VLRDEDFEAFVSDVVAYETASIPHNQHPSLEVFFAQLAGEIAPDIQSRFVGHLATCPECRARLQSLKEALHEEERGLNEQKRVAGFGDFIHAHQEPASLGARLRKGLRDLFVRREFRPALALALSSVVAVALTLAVAVPLLRGPVIATSARISSVRDQVRALQGQVSNLTQWQSGVLNNSTIIGVSPEELTLLSKDAEKVTDPWLRGLLIAVFLNEHKIRVPEGFDWQHPKKYSVRSGETWKGLSFAYFGNEELWVLIWLLNAVKLSPNEPLAPGQEILLPTPLE